MRSFSEFGYAGHSITWENKADNLIIFATCHIVTYISAGHLMGPLGLVGGIDWWIWKLGATAEENDRKEKSHTSFYI